MLVIRADPQGLDSYGGLEIEVPAFGRTFKVVIHLADGADTVSDKTARSIDDIANLTSESRCRIRKLLYDDAMRARQEVAFGDPTAPPEEAPSGFFRRLFRRPGKYRFVALGLDDPRHPCCFKNGVEGVDEKVQWLEFRIDEGQLFNRGWAAASHCDGKLWDRRRAHSCGVH